MCRYWRNLKFLLFTLAASTRRHSLSSPSATTEQISQNTDDEKVPMNLKEMFDELATENALDLHDKLEQREKYLPIFTHILAIFQIYSCQ